MTATGQNFEIYQGDDKRIIITAKDVDGNIINLAGHSVIWCAYDQTLENIIIQKSTSNGISIPTPASGEIIITLEGLDTSSVIPKNYGHQCEIKDSFDKHYTITTGFMKVIKSITHSLL